MLYRNKKYHLLIFSLVVIFLYGVLTIIYINKNGFYPLGRDVFGHLFKAQTLYETIKEKRFFLNYSEAWYNGFQPFRYSAPFSYYFLALLNFFSENIIFTYNFTMFLFLIVGALGWFFNGMYINNIWISLVIGILWFFVPNNLRTLFLEGNIPSFFINTLLPFILLFFQKCLKEDRVINYIMLSVMLSISTLTSAVSSIMIIISIFIVLLIESIVRKKVLKNLKIFLYSVLGIFTASFWLYPAFKGKLSMLREFNSAGAIGNRLFSLSTSLNPILRFKDREVVYFGVSFLLLALFGILFKNREGKSGFYVGVILFLGISNVVYSFLKIIKINDQLLINSFFSISIAFILISFLTYTYLRKELIVFWILLISLDCFISARILVSSDVFPRSVASQLISGLEVSSERIALLDNKTFGSFPSYYLKFNSINNKINQVFGWEKQGEENNKDITRLNNSLENNYYNYLFDRSLELGADTLIVKKDLVSDLQGFYKASNEIGYQIVKEDKDTIILKFPVNYSFGTSNEYKGVAIGKYANNITYIFPSLYVGESEYIDDYNYEELRDKKVVFLSGYRYKDKGKAEDLLLRLSRGDVKVIVDMAGIKENTLYNIIPQEIVVREGFKEFYYKGEDLSLSNFPSNVTEWKTNFFNISNIESYAVIESKIISYILKKDNENLSFLALNIPYYSYVTKDNNCIKILEDLMNLKAYEVPKRKVCKVRINLNENNIFIESGSKNTILPMVYGDYLKRNTGEFENINNLVEIKSKNGVFKIIYPGFYEGVIISIISVSLIAILSSIVVVTGRKNE